jgi:hypothetical protein
VRKGKKGRNEYAVEHMDVLLWSFENQRASIVRAHEVGKPGAPPLEIIPWFRPRWRVQRRVMEEAGADEGGGG